MKKLNVLLLAGQEPEPDNSFIARFLDKIDDADMRIFHLVLARNFEDITEESRDLCDDCYRFFIDPLDLQDSSEDEEEDYTEIELLIRETNQVTSEVTQEKTKEWELFCCHVIADEEFAEIFTKMVYDDPDLSYEVDEIEYETISWTTFTSLLETLMTIRGKFVIKQSKFN